MAGDRSVPHRRRGLDADVHDPASRKYSGLFADGGSFDIPANITAGLAYDLTPDLTVMADWRHIFYSGVPTRDAMRASRCCSARSARRRPGLRLEGHGFGLVRRRMAHAAGPRAARRLSLRHQSDPDQFGDASTFSRRSSTRITSAAASATPSPRIRRSTSPSSTLSRTTCAVRRRCRRRRRRRSAPITPPPMSISGCAALEIHGGLDL